MFIEILDRLKGERGPLLPKKKPEKELKKIRDANFEKAKPALENPDEVREMFNTGGSAGSTRLFVQQNINKIKKDYLKGMSVPELTKKYLPNMKGFSTTLDTVLKENLTEAEKAKRPDIIGRNKFQQVMKDPKKLKAILEDIPKMANKEVLEKHKISNVTLNDIKNKYNLKFGKKLKKPIDPKVTDRLQKTVNAIESVKLPEGQIDGNKPIIKQLATKLNKTIPDFLSDISRIKQEPDRFKISKQLRKDLGRFPEPKFFRESLKAQGFGKKTIDTVTAVEKAAKQAVSSGSNLEHALPQSLIKEFKLPKKYLLTAERTSRFLNQFKKQFDNQLLKAAKEYSAGNISYPDYKKEVARISKVVSDKTGGYKIGYVDFIDGKAVPVTPQESLLKGEGDLGRKTKGLKNFFKNAIFHNRLFENYKSNPKDPAFSTLRDEVKKKPGQFIKEVDAEKTARAISSFTKPQQYFDFYKKNPDNIFFKALTRVASMRGGKAAKLLAGGASLPFLTTALAADTGNKIDGMVPTTTIDGDLVAMETPKTDAKTLNEFSEDEGFDPLKVGGAAAAAGAAGYAARKPLLKTAEKIFTSRPAVALASPTAMAGVSASLLAENPSDPFGYAALTGTGASSKFVADKIKNPLIQRALNLGFKPAQVARAARFTTPLGIGATAVASLVNSAREFQKEFDALSPEEQQAYLKEQEQFAEDLNRDEFLMAEGGPVDKKRRAVLKILGGIMSLPVLKTIAPLFKLEQAKDVGIMATEGAKLGVEKLMMLVNKIKKLGTPDKTRQTQDLQEVTVYKGKDGSEYELVEDLATGDVKVTRDKGGIGVSGDRSYDTIEDRSEFMIKKGQADETTKGKKPPDEYEEGKAVFDQDGTVADIDDVDDVTIKAIDDELDIKKGFYKGGLTDTIPPERGPMNQGVAQLYQRR